MDAQTGSPEEQLARLKALAGEWRRRAGETADPHYIEMMNRTAAEIEAKIAELEG